MSQLNNTQILYITSDLKSRGLSKGFRIEILDHICSQVSNYMDEGLSFAKAHDLSLSEFGEQGFEELTQTSPIIKQKRKIMISQLTTIISAAMLSFGIFGFPLGDPPNSHPIKEGTVINSGFGLRLDPRTKDKKYHFGIDFKEKTGSPVKATADGKVVEAYLDKAYGNKIIIKHDDEFQTLYAHMNELKVKEGQEVKQGEIIGTVGNTGLSTGPHLHYSVLKNGKYVDPEEYLESKN
ncbi:MAG: M23 family metallopeptidase [Reichenbachiella sp.]